MALWRAPLDLVRFCRLVRCERLEFLVGHGWTVDSVDVVSSRVLRLVFHSRKPRARVECFCRTLLCFVFLMFEMKFFPDRMAGKVNIPIRDISLIAKFNAKVQKGYFFDATKIVSKQLYLALAAHDGPKLCTCNLDDE